MPKARLAQIMGNLTECINLKDVPPRPEHLDWLENTALKSDDKARKAMAALCLGLIEYDKGSSSETRCGRALEQHIDLLQLSSSSCAQQLTVCCIVEKQTACWCIPTREILQSRCQS